MSLFSDTIIATNVLSIPQGKNLNNPNNSTLVPIIGGLAYDSDTGITYVGRGSSWGPVGGSGGPSSNTGPTGPAGSGSAATGHTGPAGSGVASTGPTGPAGSGSAATGHTGPAGSGVASTGPTGPAGSGSAATGHTGPAGSGTASTGPTGASAAQFAPFVWKAVYMGYDNDQTIDVQILNALYFGFNLIVLAFWRPSLNFGAGAPDPFGGLDKWSALSSTTKAFIKSTAQTLGAKIVLSAGGSSETPYTLNPITVATNACNYAIAQTLDGVDWDLENIQLGFLAPGNTSAQLLAWFQALGNTSRATLGPSRIIAHAPQVPYLCPAWVQPGGTNGYYQVYANNPDINALLVQYYNQTAQFNSYTTIFKVGPPDFPLSAIEEIHTFSTPIPLNKIVLGVYLQNITTDTTFPESLPNIPLQWRDWINQAYNDFSWNAGMMVWQYHPNGAPTAQTWVQTIFPQ
jgi:hypothetical protein